MIAIVAVVNLILIIIFVIVADAVVITKLVVDDADVFICRYNVGC